ncbi:MAG: YqhG family protein, partial [Alicyclobacillus sp.]|nr:YqhG family protein [Alicyclobacillus sp.]
VTLGSFRLDKIFASLDQRGRFAAVVPRHAPAHAPLEPWLLALALVSRRCDLTEQHYLSAGINLVTGQVADGLYDAVCRIELAPLATHDPRLKPAQWSVEAAVTRLRRHWEHMFARGPYTWAQEANRRLQTELAQVRAYYQSILPDVPEAERALVTAEQARREREVKERMQPRIEVELRQMALLALAERAPKH